jgi:glycosyltransferase involved in cell wall biosynthesis
MATYNMSKYIHSIIKSTLNQTYDDFEFIIVDDASRDATIDVIKSFQDPRINLIRNKENLKAAIARNIAIEHARGEYIAVCDADDINLPNRLEIQTQYLDSHPNIDVVGSSFYIFNGKGEINGGVLCQNIEHKDLTQNIIWQIPLAHPTIMAKAEWFKRFRYRKEFHRSQDFELFLRTYNQSCFANIPEFLYAYRDTGYINFKKVLWNNWFKIVMILRYRKEYCLPVSSIMLLPPIILGRLMYYLVAKVFCRSIFWRQKKGLQRNEDICQAQKWLNYCLDTNRADMQKAFPKN